MMTDFNIRRGLSSVLFSEPGVINPQLIIEEGCWYLCTDTAELYLGVQANDGLTLKKINGHDATKDPTESPDDEGGGEADRGLIGAYIDDAGELWVLFSDNTEESLGVVVGKNGADGKDGVDGKDGKDGLTTAVKIGDNTFEHVNGIIELPEIDLGEYAKKDDIPEAEIYKIDFNSPDYAKAVEAYNNGKILVLTNAAPDVNSYAVMNYVSEKYITFTKFLMSRSSTYGAFNTYYLRPDNTWEVAKEVRLNQVEANVEGELKGELTSLRVGKDIYKLPDLEGYATTEQIAKTYVTNAAVTELVVNEVNTAVTEQVETKVTEVIQEKVDSGEITVAVDKITYGEF